MDILRDWAEVWGISQIAINDLRASLILPVSAQPSRIVESESSVQSLIRLEGALKNVKLWRNNVGVLTNPETGQPVRYGLANDSKALSEVLKSSDLIGWRPVRIEQHHVGSLIAQFVARECKRPDWKYSGTEREQAQMRWLTIITADGGDAGFASGEGTL